MRAVASRASLDKNRNGGVDLAYALRHRHRRVQQTRRDGSSCREREEFARPERLSLLLLAHVDVVDQQPLREHCGPIGVARPLAADS